MTDANVAAAGAAGATEVRDDKDKLRYEILLDGTVVGFIQYTMRDGRLVFVHTEVQPVRQRKGLASELVQRALDDVRRRDLRMVPECPFVEHYIATHPDYDDLVDHELFDAMKAEDK